MQKNQKLQFKLLHRFYVSRWSHRGELFSVKAIGVSELLSFFHDLVQFLICKALVYFETSHRIYVLARTEKNKSFYMNKDLQNSKALQMYKKPALCRAPEQGVRDVTVMSLMFGVPSTSGTNIFGKPEVEFSTSNVPPNVPQMGPLKDL